MDMKKAIFSGIISYAVIFLVISAMMFVPGAYAANQWAAWSQYLILAIGFVIAYLVGRYYYFKTKPSKAMNEGLMLGIVMAVVALIIEIPVMVYGFASAMGWAWLGQWNIWVGYLLVVIAAIVAAYTKK